MKQPKLLRNFIRNGRFDAEQLQNVNGHLFGNPDDLMLFDFLAEHLFKRSNSAWSYVNSQLVVVICSDDVNKLHVCSVYQSFSAPASVAV